MAIIMAVAMLLPFGVMPANAEDGTLVTLSNTGSSNASSFDVDAFERQYGDMLDALAQGLTNHSDSVNIYNYRLLPSMLPEVLSYLRYYKMCWFLDTQYSYSWDGTYVYAFIPTYVYTGDQITAYNTLIYSKFDEVIEKASALSTQVEKLLYLHNYLVDNIEYDQNGNDEQNNTYGAMVLGCSMCEGYSESFAYMANELGIPAYVITSSALGHAWNLVLLDGYFYHIDCTWDDPVISNPNLISYPISGYCQNSNFLCSDSAITATGHSSTDWKVNSIAANGIAENSDMYSDFDLKAQNVLSHYSNGAWFYTETDGTASSKSQVNFKIKKLLFLSNSSYRLSTERQIYTYYAISSSSYYKTFYATLQQIGDNIYYNKADGIYKYVPGGASNGSDDLLIMQNSVDGNIYDYDIDLAAHTFTVIYGKTYAYSDTNATTLTYNNADYFCANDEHIFILQSTVAPTDAVDGTNVYCCIACGEYYTEPIYCRHTVETYITAGLNSQTGDSDYTALADLNSDGYINMRDYSILEHEYNQPAA